MKFNLNDTAPTERDFSGNYDVIPDDTEVRVVAHRIAGDDADTNGILTHSKGGESRYLHLEFTVIGGEYNKKRFWERLTLAIDGEETPGRLQAVNISKQKLRAIVDAAKGLAPTDMSPVAMKARQIDLKELDGMEFDCVVSVEKAKPGSGFKDQNSIKRVLNDAAPPNGKAIVSDRPKTGAASEKRKAAFAG